MLYDVSKRAQVVALLAPMPSELRPLVRMLSLRRSTVDGMAVREGTLGAARVVATRTGMGTERARRVTEQVVETLAPRHVVVVGVAGGVGEGLAVGDVVVPEEVVDHATAMVFRAHPLGNMELRGRIFTTDDLLVDPSERARALPPDVDALDMETSAVADVCQQHGVPWTAVRSLSDHVDGDLVDDAVFGLAHPDGSPNVAAIGRYVATRPWKIPRLARLGRDLRTATHAAAREAVGACREHDWDE